MKDSEVYTDTSEHRRGYMFHVTRQVSGSVFENKSLRGKMGAYAKAGTIQKCMVVDRDKGGEGERGVVRTSYHRFPKIQIGVRSNEWFHGFIIRTHSRLHHRYPYEYPSQCLASER